MPFDPKRPPQSEGPVAPQADGSAVAGRMFASFEPRLILPEPAPTTDQGDLDLPDDLAALAEQLQDDAAHLANCYGPETTCETSTPPRATAGLCSSATMRVLLLTTAAAILALTFSIGLFANRERLAGQADRQSPTAPSKTLTNPVPPQLAITHEPQPGLESLAHDSLDQSESLLLLGDASGPEREGLLDLLQQTASAETSISF